MLHIHLLRMPPSLGPHYGDALPDLQVERLGYGDSLLICRSGVWDLVTHSWSGGRASGSPPSPSCRQRCRCTSPRRQIWWRCSGSGSHCCGRSGGGSLAVTRRLQGNAFNGITFKIMCSHVTKDVFTFVFRMNDWCIILGKDGEHIYLKNLFIIIHTSWSISSRNQPTTSEGFELHFSIQLQHQTTEIVHSARWLTI